MKKLLNPGRDQWPEICLRPTMDMSDLEQIVLPIFDEVRQAGDAALKKYTEKFDGVRIEELSVAKGKIERSEEQIDTALKNAIERAYNNIYKFHKAQQTTRIELETTTGVKCWQEKRPIEKVGLYIPGGSAPLFSTILMLAIPAKIAGCKEIVLCTPPNATGNIDPVILYTAALCGVKNVFKIGGIQAIAGMTFGTESLPRVYKIFGPGNQFVTVAKQVATRFGLAIDMPAGPSELLVVADQTSEPQFIAADLLSQAEHGPDSQVVLVTTDKNLISEVELEVEEQLRELPRSSIAEKAIANSKIVFFPEAEIAAEFINEYGPEHYIVCSENEDFYLEAIQNAGSVFVGKYTPESAGDYASGTNHTLPTQGYSKQFSGVNLDSFLKSITFQKISDEGLLNIGETIELMAEAEGLIGHKNAVSLRLRRIKQTK